MAPFCLDLLQGPDFCAIRKLCRFSGDYPSGKGFCCFLSLCHIHGFRGRSIVNCAINYGWVFHAEDCKKTHVAVKYLFVWGGSIILNTLGHFCTDRVAYGHDMVNGLSGYYIDNVFILSKIIVAVLVAFFLELPSATFFSFIVITNIKGFLKHYLENKKDEYEYRDWLQQVIYKIINPVVHGMIRIGITPNFITTTGLVLNIVAAALFVYAGVYKSGELAYGSWGAVLCSLPGCLT